MNLRAIILSFGFLFATLPARAEVLVFAAASLKEPLDRIAQEFGDVTVSYGGSGTLARQISLGAPADIVLLANTDWMDFLVEGANVNAASVAAFASNSLVLIGPAGQGPIALEAEAILDILGDGRIAMGLTMAVPAGIYGKAGLQSLGVWALLQDRLAEVDSVRAALALVARGQTPLGIVYQTDLRVSDAVSQIAVFPTDSHPPIRYVGATVSGADPEAAAFWAFLRSAEGREIFAAAGFLAPADAS